jgi:hypothetical protein
MERHLACRCMRCQVVGHLSVCARTRGNTESLRFNVSSGGSREYVDIEYKTKDDL